MHFLTLATVKASKIEEAYMACIEAEPEMAQLKQLLQKPREDDLLADILWEKFINICTPFSCAVVSAVGTLMERYNSGTENPEYREFYDMTEEIQNDYENPVDCLKLPQGRIVPVCGRPYWGRFVIHNDGKVYETHSGPLRHDKRTKRAKRIKALPGCSWKNLYSDLHKFAEAVYPYDFYEEQNAYGYYSNPEGRWDWYQIGGRWPYMLLVKDTCSEYSPGERSWCCGDQIPEAPEGYLWVSGARMKDIQWQAMRDWRYKKLAERFAKLESFFLTGEQPENIYGRCTEDGIINRGCYLYHKGETLEEYLARCRVPSIHGFSFSVDELVSEDGWQSTNDFGCRFSQEKELRENWNKALQAYLDSIGEDDVLVVIDCRM